MGGGLAKKEIIKNNKIYKSKNRKNKYIYKNCFFYLGKAAVAPLPIYCLVHIAFFLIKAR